MQASASWGLPGLAMRRLSIIDLDTGQQPILSDDGAIALVFNGEIYNYLELREACVRDGQRFHTKSDTEVILRLYEKYGADCTTFLNGMFAFAIWDSPRQQLLLGRDRLGIKPLYYTVQHDTLFFASEIKSLLQHPQVSFDIDQTAIAEFMTFGFVQTPRTIFSGIFRVPEGHVLTWSAGNLRVRQYLGSRLRARGLTLGRIDCRGNQAPAAGRRVADAAKRCAGRGAA